MQIILQTPRLTLREFTDADAPLVQALNSEAPVLQYIPEARVETTEQALKILLEIILPQYEQKLGRWAVHLNQGNEFIGWCGLKWLQENGAIDLGYRYKETAWGKGFATEAASAVLKYGHHQLELPKIIAHAHVDNIASQKVLEKIRMQFVGEGVDNGLPVKGYVSFNNNL